MGKKNGAPLKLMPGSPYHKYLVGLIEEYLKDKVDDPAEVALHIWRLTRTKARPVASPK